jgi:hypothetical protein
MHATRTSNWGQGSEIWAIHRIEAQKYSPDVCIRQRLMHASLWVGKANADFQNLITLDIFLGLVDLPSSLLNAIELPL